MTKKIKKRAVNQRNVKVKVNNLANENVSKDGQTSTMKGAKPKADMHNQHPVSNLAVRLEYLADGGTVMCDNNLSILCPDEVHNISAIFIRSILQSYGRKYKIVNEEEFKEGICYHTNIPVEVVVSKGRKTTVDVKVCQEDIEQLGVFRTCDGNLTVICSLNTYKIEEIFLRSILKCYGQEYRIEEKIVFDDCAVFKTNLPCKKLDIKRKQSEMNVKVRREDLINIGFSVKYKDGKMRFLCNKETSSIEAVLLSSILKGFGDQFKIVGAEAHSKGVLLKTNLTKRYEEYI